MYIYMLKEFTVAFTSIYKLEYPYMPPCCGYGILHDKNNSQVLQIAPERILDVGWILFQRYTYSYLSRAGEINFTSILRIH